jgi:hypothetical protein
MLNLTPQHRIRIPDSVAVLAVLLLLVCSAAKIESGQEAISAGKESNIATKADSTGFDRVIDTAEKRSRGLNLGLLLFRRG